MKVKEQWKNAFKIQNEILSQPNCQWKGNTDISDMKNLWKYPEHPLLKNSLSLCVQLKLRSKSGRGRD